MMCAARFFFAPLFLALLLPFSGSQGGFFSIAHLSPTSVRGFLFFLRPNGVCLCMLGFLFDFRDGFFFSASFSLFLLISEASIDDDGDHAKYRFHYLKCVCVCVLCCSTKDNYLSCVRLCSIFRSCLSLPPCAPCTATSQSRSVMRRAA